MNIMINKIAYFYYYTPYATQATAQRATLAYFTKLRDTKT